MTNAPLAGFEARFVDLPDYILRITQEIWEGRQVGAIGRYYHPDCLVHTGMGSGTGGAEAVIAGTLEKMHQFPDRRILAEDVVWSGDAAAGFLSSHRSMMVQTHLGNGPLGTPTGRPLAFRAIADCACIDNRIYEEWLVVDQAAAAIQAGVDPVALGAALAAADVAAGLPPPATGLSQARPGPDTRTLSDDPAAVRVADAYRGMWEDRHIGVADGAYTRGVDLRLPGGRSAHGRDAVAAFVTSYLASFPDARFAVDHSIALREPDRSVRVATRWTLVGTHTGHGRFGLPSGAPMFVMGISHAELIGDAIANEWIMVDELAVWRRIARHRLETSAA